MKQRKNALRTNSNVALLRLLRRITRTSFMGLLRHILLYEHEIMSKFT